MVTLAPKSHNASRLTRTHCIGIDIGGNKVNVALIDPTGTLFYKEVIETKQYLAPKKLVAKLAGIVKTIQTNHPDKHIKGIGIGAAGIVDHERGIITFSPNIGWHNFNLGTMMHKATKLPVVVDNDANAAAWGIYYLHYANSFRHFLCVTLGTGIGGGFIFDKKVYRGASGAAGEIGHMTLIPDGLACSCGNRGCIERYAGTRGIVERTEQYLQEKGVPITSLFPDENNNRPLTPEVVATAAAQGNEHALHIWKQTGDMLGTMFASVINLLNIELIYITGGLAYAQPWIEKPIKDAIKQRAFTVPARAVKIIFAKHKKDTGVIGAGLLVLEQTPPMPHKI